MARVREPRIGEPERIQWGLDTRRDTSFDSELDGAVSFLHPELNSSTRTRSEHIRSPRRSPFGATKDAAANLQALTLALRDNCLRRTGLTCRLHRRRSGTRPLTRSIRLALRTATKDRLNRAAGLVNISATAAADQITDVVMLHRAAVNGPQKLQMISRRIGINNELTTLKPNRATPRQHPKHVVVTRRITGKHTARGEPRLSPGCRRRMIRRRAPTR